MNSPKTPEQLHQALAAAFNAKDIDQVVALFAPEAALVSQPDQIALGATELRRALAGFLAVPGTMHLKTVYSVQSGNLALTRSSWTIRDGDEVKARAHGTEVMKRQTDGTWRFAVDHPFGAEAWASD